MIVCKIRQMCRWEQRLYAPSAGDTSRHALWRKGILFLESGTSRNDPFSSHPRGATEKVLSGLKKMLNKIERYCTGYPDLL